MNTSTPLSPSPEDGSHKINYSLLLVAILVSPFGIALVIFITMVLGYVLRRRMARCLAVMYEQHEWLEQVVHDKVNEVEMNVERTLREKKERNKMAKQEMVVKQEMETVLSLNLAFSLILYLALFFSPL